MANFNSTTETMRTLRFHEYGEPESVLHLETVPVPIPGPNRIRIAVYACGLAPADWALCRGLFKGQLPRGIGIDVSGTVDAIGEGVTDVSIGDHVLGSADWAGGPTAGASDRAIMNRWTLVPAGLDMIQAAAMTMAVDTAYSHLACLGIEAGQTILINGAGTTIGYAAVQMALIRGLKVIATAGETYAQQLRQLGATVTPYGENLVERVKAIHNEPVDFVFDTTPASNALPALVQIAAGNPKRVITSSDLAAAAELGVRDIFHEDRSQLVDVLPEFAQLAAEGKFTIPVARTFPLDEWRTALNISLSGQAHGKLLLLG